MKDMVLGIFLIIFGLVTIRSGGNVLFGSEEARLAAGAYVPFVLWSNFIGGFFYVGGAVAILMKKPWARSIAKWIALATWFLFVAFGVHVLLGGAYELRTLAAMVIRSFAWTMTVIILSSKKEV